MPLASLILAAVQAAPAQEFAWTTTETPPVSLQEPALPPWLADRGEGVHNSMFGTYTAKNEFQVYLFYEYTVNHDQEYKPDELGFVGAQDYLARRTDHEFLIFLAYGITEDLMVEFESALWTKGTQKKAGADTSAMPSSLSESGLGDTEGQIRYRFVHESEGVPEVLAFFEYVIPLQRKKKIIGSQAWEFQGGVYVTKGFSFGTLMGRIGYAYDRGEKKAELGEYQIEYVKRLSPQTRIVFAVEGEQDEIAAIVEFQWMPVKNVMFKFNCGFGVTPKAPDFAPEVGIYITF